MIVYITGDFILRQGMVFESCMSGAVELESAYVSMRGIRLRVVQQCIFPMPGDRLKNDLHISMPGDRLKNDMHIPMLGDRFENDLWSVSLFNKGVTSLFVYKKAISLFVYRK